MEKNLFKAVSEEMELLGFEFVVNNNSLIIYENKKVLREILFKILTDFNLEFMKKGEIIGWSLKGNYIVIDFFKKA